jgi:hypothetical protein
MLRGIRQEQLGKLEEDLTLPVNYYLPRAKNGFHMLFWCVSHDFITCYLNKNKNSDI